MSLPLSGSQTVGPYFSIGLNALCTDKVACAGDGDCFVIEGQLLDKNGVGIPDGMLEVWQAGRDGQYAKDVAHSAPEALGFGRIRTEADGRFRFQVEKPGAVPYDARRMQAPHLLVLVYMRGLLRNLVTRLYFPNEAANAADPVLQLVPAERRGTLVASAGERPGTLHWDIVVRAEAGSAKPETVFFAW